MLDNSILEDLSIYSEEFTLGNGSTACLLIHGLGCGPIQMRELAECLCKWDFTARGILLPGHCGEDIENLELISGHDLREKVEYEYQQLKEEYENVVVIGFSLGALLTLQLAMKYPIEKIILMGTPVFILHECMPLNGLIDLFRIFVRRLKTIKKTCYMETDRYSGCLYQPIESYYSLQTISEINQMIETIKPRLKEVKSSALVIHSKRDLIAAPSSARYVVKHLSSAEKQLVWLERSHHLMMYDEEKDVIFQAIKEFVTR
jgi:carboxylesterase